MDDSFFDIPVELHNNLDKRIAEAFSVYDTGKNLMIESARVGSILRSMGCVPDEKEITQIIKSTEFESYEGKIHLSRFLPHVKELLYGQKMMPASSMEILEAFKVLDPKGRGFLRKHELVAFMNEHGEAFDEKEMSDFIDSAVDPETNKLDYELYTIQIAHEPADDDDIYKLAAMFKHEKTQKAKK
jgi:Ca2+-binding EF-hand superfamily protein